MKKDFVGIGYNPKESSNHFYIVIPENTQEQIYVYERFHWDEDGKQLIRKSDILKLTFSRYKWSLIVKDVLSEFNGRLKDSKKPTGKFHVGGNPLEKMLGKELMVLLW